MAEEAERDIGVRIGDVIAEKYRVEERIGIGGMGAVVAARHLELGARVAIKLLLPDSARDPESVRRFSAEARAMFNLKSEHVAKVQDVGKLRNGRPYMVMEYLVGSDLATTLRAGTLAPREVVHLVLQACEAVAEAHSLGIIHRDIKPQNLFLAKRVDGSACIKVLDFGISKVPAQSGEHMSITHSSAVMGTPLYMSPEQLHSTADVDARSDIWALGVVLYELLTGRTPYEAPSAPALYAKMLSTPAIPPAQLYPEISEGLSLCVMRCLAVDRTKRYASVADLATALEPFAPEGMSGAGVRLHAVHERNTERRLPAALAPPAAGSPPATIATWEGTTKRRRKTAVAAVIGGVGGVVLFVGLIAFLHARSTAAPSVIVAAAPDDNASAQPTASSTMVLASASPSPSSSALSTTPNATTSATAESTPHAHVTTPRKTQPHPPASSNSLLNQRTW